jgi:hypothetical protein
LRTRTTARLAAVGAALAMLLPAGASANVTYLLTDASGDANGINPQGLGDIVPGTPNDQTTPVQVAEYDIRGVRYTTVYETQQVNGVAAPVAVGVEMRLALGALPTATSAPAIIRLAHQAGGCDMFLLYFGGTNGQPTQPHGSGRMQINCEGDTLAGRPTVPVGAALQITADAANKEIVWTYTFGTGAAADRYLKPGSSLVPTNPHIRGNSGAATVPVIDEVYNPQQKSFRIGSDAPPAA